MSDAEDLLPKYEHEYFNNRQLAVSLVQLRYSPAPRYSDEKAATLLKEALGEEYPLIAPAAIVGMVVSSQGISQSQIGTSLHFSSLDQRWIVDVSDSAVSLETHEYEEIADFAARFLDILHIVAEHLKPRYQLRFGLRYVNEFRYDQAHTYNVWRSLLNSELLGLGARGILGGTVEQTLGEVRTRREDGTLLVRHGFLNGTTVSATEAHPAKTGPFYLLDLDYYDEAPKKFGTEDVPNQLTRYNDVLYRVFRWVIGNGELYEHLRG